jgi:hypothetical protein
MAKNEIAPTQATGRPSLYTAEIAREVIERLAAGESLRAICRDQHMPSEQTIRAWALDDVEGFAADYFRARKLAYLHEGDEILAIADDSSGDYTVDEQGRTVVNHENINRSRLRVETRKWVLSKMLPKIYGDKVEVSGPGGTALAAPVFNIAFVAPQSNDGQS